MTMHLKEGEKFQVFEKQVGIMETFVIKIMDRKNASWQGSVTWTEQKTEQHFRSALELIKLIDGALDEQEYREGGSHES